MNWIRINETNKPPKNGRYMCFVPDSKNYNEHWDEYYWDGNNFIDTQPVVGMNRIVPATHYMIIENPNTFQGFPKMGRLSREMIITEKIDGTNGQILITEENQILVGSRTRWITPDNDNYGFARWVEGHREEILKLGSGRHFGEWWGSGVQRGYGLPKGEKRFSLFNVSRWALFGTEPQRIPTADPTIEKYQEVLPECVGLVPILYRGLFDTTVVNEVLNDLKINGSYASKGFMNPEGIVVYHVAGNVGFKKTIEKDDTPKSKH